jgi:hypothetical protein
MTEINFIITVYDREDYWKYLKNILDGYVTIKSNYVVCYSGDRDDFEFNFRLKNKINGGRGNNHHIHASPHVDMEFDLIIGGYELLKNNNVTNWIKLSVDSWLLDENKIKQIVDFLDNEDCVYGGNEWYSHINLSTDIFFANTKKHNIFEDLKIHGKHFLDWLYYKQIPTGLENLMRYIVIPYDYVIIMDREPLTSDGTRWLCPELGWCMSHCLETNVEFLENYKTDNKRLNLKKIQGNKIPYSFDWYLKNSGQKI